MMKYLGELVYAFIWKIKATAGVHACLELKDSKRSFLFLDRCLEAEILNV